jgi:hypothetical protein
MAKELGIAFEHQATDWRTCGENPDYLAINPAGAIPCMNLKNAVDGVVGVNLFAKTIDYVRINSHLQIQFNMLNKNDFLFNCVY